MVEEYFGVKKKLKEADMKISRMSRKMKEQEKIINELRAFLDDALSDIFHTVEIRQCHIFNTVKKFKNIKASFFDDPFALYQSYVDLVKPIDYRNENQDMMAKVLMLESQINEANHRTDAVQAATQRYLAEEKEIKSLLKKAKEQLSAEFKAHECEVKELKENLKDLQSKYDFDVSELKKDIKHITEFSTLQNQLNEAIIKTYAVKKEELDATIRNLKAILHTPYLYTTYSKKRRRMIDETNNVNV
jgi:predicted  nucleic acid-binding Zn-ribbon protein